MYGCTNPIAFNYNALANQDDGFCHLPILDCGDSTTAFMQFTGGDYNYLISWEMNGIEGDSYPFDLQQGQFCLADGCYIYNMYSDTSQAPSWLDPSQHTDAQTCGQWRSCQYAISRSGSRFRIATPARQTCRRRVIQCECSRGCGGAAGISS